MNDKIEQLKKEFKDFLKKLGIKTKEEPTKMTTMATTYEINLVPEVKIQMLKVMRTRNLTLFVCIIVAAASAGAVGILASVTGGQNVVLTSQDDKMELMSNKIKGYRSLPDLLTIQKQLEGISAISEQKNVMSRVFPFVTAILPSAPDEIKISELNVNLETNTLSMEAQANAKVAPLIDYRVLESFKKGLPLTKYDYGRYVDSEGNQIPTYCIVEYGEDGELLNENGNIYAYWMRGTKGCDPVRDDTLEEDEAAEDEEKDDEKDDDKATLKPNMSLGVSDLLSNLANSKEEKEEEEKEDDKYTKYYESLTDFEKTLADKQIEFGEARKQNVKVEKIWRTPRFTEWYRSGQNGKDASMELDGTISGVAHFESECVKYEGNEAGGVIKWTTTNDCLFAEEEMMISDSSNGRDSSDNLVLRFSASIIADEGVFKFSNKHMIAIGPTGQNVTDSYKQIQGMFAEKAADCADMDVVCTSSTENRQDANSKIKQKNENDEEEE